MTKQIAGKYTIIAEAKDRGAKVQLSSSATITVTVEDGNNHLPKFLETSVSLLKQPPGEMHYLFWHILFLLILQQMEGSVMENVNNVLVCRVQAEDKDTTGTAAWKVEYQIHGDTDNNFHIETDPETNDGLLYVKKVQSILYFIEKDVSVLL